MSKPSDFTPKNINLGHIIPILSTYVVEEGFPGGSVVKNLPANAGDIRDTGTIPGLGRSPRGGCKGGMKWDFEVSRCKTIIFRMDKQQEPTV